MADLSHSSLLGLPPSSFSLSSSSPHSRQDSYQSVNLIMTHSIASGIKGKFLPPSQDLAPDLLSLLPIPLLTPGELNPQLPQNATSVCAQNAVSSRHGLDTAFPWLFSKLSVISRHTAATPHETFLIRTHVLLMTMLPVSPQN